MGSSEYACEGGAFIFSLPCSQCRHFRNYQRGMEQFDLLVSRIRAVEDAKNIAYLYCCAIGSVVGYRTYMAEEFLLEHNLRHNNCSKFQPLT